MSDPGVIVVGGGVVGLSTAYHLAGRGVPVTVLDSGQLQTSASAGNAGILAPGHPPLPRPGLVMQTLKWMLSPTSPLYVPLMSVDPALLGWMWQFRKACNPEQFARSTRILCDLGHAAREEFDRLISEENIDCHYTPGGWLEVYRDAPTMQSAQPDVDLMRSGGFAVEQLDRDTLLEREPAFDASVVGAFHCRDGAAIHPPRFLKGLAEAAQHRGAHLRLGTEVTTFLKRGSRVVSVACSGGRRIDASTVVLAAGSWSTRLAREVGLRIPMQPGKGYHVNVPALETPLQTATVLADRHVAVTPMGEYTRLAGTVELSGMNLTLHPKRVSMMQKVAEPYLPGIAKLQASPGWCGLRPCVADGLPILGWAPKAENLYIATGHAKMGLTLGPHAGRLVAETIVDGKPSMEIDALSPARFG